MGVKLSELAAAAPLAGDEIVPIVQAGGTRRTSAAGIAALAAANGAAKTDLSNVAATFAPIFGGVTSAFPALKRIGAGLGLRLGDDSGDAAFTAQQFTASGMTFTFGANGNVNAGAGDGVFTLVNNAGTAFDRLQFGGAGIAYPALVRSGTALHAMLADKSAFTVVRAAGVVLNNGSQIGDGGGGGVINLTDGAGSGFGRLVFGVISASYPALKRSGVGLQARLADDSAYTNVDAEYFMAAGGSYYFGGVTSAYPRLKRNSAQLQVRLADDSADADLAAANLTLSGLTLTLGARGNVNAGAGDGIFTLVNGAGTGFSRLQFGGTSNGFPSLKRNAAVLECRLADDSGFASVMVSTVRTNAATVGSLPTAATAGSGARAFVTDATTSTFAATVVGGGANKVPVYSDGTNWLIG